MRVPTDRGPGSSPGRGVPRVPGLTRDLDEWRAAVALIDLRFVNLASAASDDGAFCLHNGFEAERRDLHRSNARLAQASGGTSGWDVHSHFQVSDQQARLVRSSRRVRNITAQRTLDQRLAACVEDRPYNAIQSTLAGPDRRRSALNIEVPGQARDGKRLNHPQQSVSNPTVYQSVPTAQATCRPNRWAETDFVPKGMTNGLETWDCWRSGAGGGGLHDAGTRNDVDEFGSRCQRRTANLARAGRVFLRYHAGERHTRGHGAPWAGERRLLQIGAVCATPDPRQRGEVA